MSQKKKVTWFDNYFGWLERLLKKLWKLMKEEEEEKKVKT